MSVDSVNLSPGEAVVWSGVPSRHPLLRPSDRRLIPFSFLWGGISIWIALSTMAGGVRLTNAFFTLPIFGFAAVGVYMIAGRFFVTRSIASRRTRYVVTDSRVIVIGGLSGRSVGSAYLSQLPPPVVSENPDGSGTLAFGSSTSRSIPWGPDPVWPPLFREIPNVRYVRDLITARQKAAGAGS